ncbi:hypothetical protein [Streptomyces sp. NPDC057552]
MLLITPVPQAWVAFTAPVALLGPLVVAFGEAPVQGLTSVVSHMVGGRALFGMRAVDRERLRFARDLHDLCGCSLTAVALQ